MKRREFVIGAAAAVAATGLIGRAARAAEHVKWAVFTPDSEVTFKTVMKPYAATVEKETNGAVVFDMFPNGMLGRAPGAQPQMLLDGVADIGWIVPSYSPGRFPDTEVFELPGLFKDLAETDTVISRLSQTNLLHDYGDFYNISMFGTAPYSIHTNFPVKTVADLKGKKIRASSATESAALRAFGAVPVGMPVTQIPEAISRHTIDGTTSWLPPFFDFGINRVTNYHFFIGLGVVPLAILMNKKRYDSLPEAVRADMKRNGGEALGNQFTQHVGAYFNELMKRLKDDPKQHVIVPTEAEYAAAQAMLAPVRDEWVAKSPRHKELKAAVDAEIAKVRRG
ncbi:MAG TPA: TRAP transporter substrate-binding protein [Stellaceae bacterium]